MLKKLKENEKGFTLIELIIVIAILGILAMILLPKFTGFTKSAGEKAVLSEAKNIDTAIQAQEAEEGTAPAAGKENEVWDYLGKKAPTDVKDGKLTLTGSGNFTYSKEVHGKTYEATKNGDSLTCVQKP